MARTVREQQDKRREEKLKQVQEQIDDGSLVIRKIDEEGAQGQPASASQGEEEAPLRSFMRVGLVLGAGGVLGGAWLTGGLHALASETGWDPATADRLVGTSAGSMIGRSSRPACRPGSWSPTRAGESFEGLTGPDGRPAREADRAGGAVFKLHRGLPWLGPGSLRLALTTLAQPAPPHAARRCRRLAAERARLHRLAQGDVRRAVPDGWVDHPNFWAVACDYSTGRRVPFGRDDAPHAELADAVAASCAIPASTGR